MEKEKRIYPKARLKRMVLLKQKSNEIISFLSSKRTSIYGTFRYNNFDLPRDQNPYFVPRRKHLKEQFNISEFVMRDVIKILCKIGVWSVKTIPSDMNKYKSEIIFNPKRMNIKEIKKNLDDYMNPLIETLEDLCGIKKINQTPSEDRRDFLRNLEGNQTFVLINEKKKEKTEEIFIKKITPSIMRELKKKNEEGFGIFTCINEQKTLGRSSENTERVRALFADFDNGANLVQLFKLDPSLVIETSPNNYHAYWFRDDVNKEDFKTLQQKIAVSLNSDSSICDLPRIMRVPGFYHHKGTKFMSKIIYKGQGTGLDTHKLPDIPPKTFLRKITDSFTYGASQGERNSSTIRIIGGMIRKLYDWSKIESEVRKHNAACSPPMKESELKGILRSGRKYYDRDVLGIV